MQIKHYPEVSATRIDNDLAKKISARVVIGSDDGAANFCMRIFELEEGGHTPLHAHDWEHEIFVHTGDGEIFGDGQWQPFRVGTVVLVPANEEHQIRNTGKGLLTFVCLVPSKAPEL